MEQGEQPLFENKITKKQVRKVIFEKLARALDDYKDGLNEKKFENKIKKATKLFVVDIAKAAKKKAVKTRK